MIDYVEIATVDPQAMRIFFEAKLGYWFKWFGPDYVALRGAGLEVGVHRADMASRSIDGGTLIVF